MIKIKILYHIIKNISLFSYIIIMLNIYIYAYIYIYTKLKIIGLLNCNVKYIYNSRALFNALK